MHSARCRICKALHLYAQQSLGPPSIHSPVAGQVTYHLLVVDAISHCRFATEGTSTTGLHNF